MTTEQKGVVSAKHPLSIALDILAQAEDSGPSVRASLIHLTLQQNTNTQASSVLSLLVSCSQSRTETADVNSLEKL